MKMEEQVINLLKGKLDEVISVTRSDNSGQVSLLVSLQEMEEFPALLCQQGDC